MSFFSKTLGLAKDALSTASEKISTEIEKREQHEQELWEKLKNELSPAEDVLCHCLISKSEPSKGYAVVTPSFLFTKDKNHSGKFSINEIKCVVYSEKKAIAKMKMSEAKQGDVFNNYDKTMIRAEKGGDTSSLAFDTIVSLGSYGISYAKAANENRFRELVIQLKDGTEERFEGYKRSELSNFIEELQTAEVVEIAYESDNSSDETDYFEPDNFDFFDLDDETYIDWYDEV